MTVQKWHHLAKLMGETLPRQMLHSIFPEETEADQCWTSTPLVINATGKAGLNLQMWIHMPHWPLHMPKQYLLDIGCWICQQVLLPLVPMIWTDFGLFAHLWCMPIEIGHALRVELILLLERIWWGLSFGSLFPLPPTFFHNFCKAKGCLCQISVFKCFNLFQSMN